MNYQASPTRYDNTMQYHASGKSGLKLPAITLTSSPIVTSC